MVFTARTRHEVNDQLTDALKDKRLGMLVAPHKQTVAQFLTWWLSDVVKPASRPKTVNFYDFVTRIHLIPAFGDMQIQKLTAQHVQAMLNDRLSSASSRTRRPLSPRSVRHIHRAVHSAERCREVQDCSRQCGSISGSATCQEAEHSILQRCRGEKFPGSRPD
jgi:Phage integrase, N-terminal SAM-like domain